jgi:CRP/FNR family transcriptional regulator, anaerobic regulatory protein
MKEILEYLIRLYGALAEEAMNFIVRRCDELTLKKGDILKKQGSICTDVWFIKAGVLRAYEFKKNGKEVCNWLMRKNDIATSVISFFMEVPSEETVEALQDCVIYKMSRKDLFTGLSKYPSMLMLTFLITAKYYCQVSLQNSFFRKKEPAGIYDDLLENHAELVQLVPENQIASFLGVTPPTYDKIKKGKMNGQAAKLKTKKKPKK